MNCQIIFLDRDNKRKLASASLSCYLQFLWKKLSLPYKLLKYFLIYLYFNEANQVVLFTLFSRKNVLKSQNWSKIHFKINQKILKAWKNNFNSLTNVLSVGEDLLGTFCKIFRLQSFVFQEIIEKTMFSKDFTSYLRIIYIRNHFCTMLFRSSL